MNRLWISLLALAALALSASAQNTRPDQGSQDRTGPTASSRQQGQKGSQQNGAQGSASVSASNSASASANAGPASAGLSSGADIHAELLTTVDARKSRPGKRVVAKTTQNVKQNGKVVLRKGTRLIGHVTEAQAKTEANAQSSLGIVFDEAVMKNGRRVPFHAAIQALAAAQSETAGELGDSDDMGSPSAMGSGNAMGSAAAGGVLGGVGRTVGGIAGASGSMAGNLGRTAGSTVGATSSATGSATGNLGGLNAAGQLTSTSQGVFGLKGLSLNSDLSNSTSGSVVTSTQRNVHLSSGTQMLLRVTAH